MTRVCTPSVVWLNQRGGVKIKKNSYRGSGVKFVSGLESEESAKQPDRFQTFCMVLEYKVARQVPNILYGIRIQSSQTGSKHFVWY
ncbi:hypothetical protein ACF0H5_006391 [Mactra antiquata]